MKSHLSVHMNKQVKYPCKITKCHHHMSSEMCYWFCFGFFLSSYNFCTIYAVPECQLKVSHFIYLPALLHTFLYLITSLWEFQYLDGFQTLIKKWKCDQVSTYIKKQMQPVWFFSNGFNVDFQSDKGLFIFLQISQTHSLYAFWVIWFLHFLKCQRLSYWL